MKPILAIYDEKTLAIVVISIILITVILCSLSYRQGVKDSKLTIK